MLFNRKTCSTSVLQNYDRLKFLCKWLIFRETREFLNRLTFFVPYYRLFLRIIFTCKRLLKESSDDYNVNIMITHWKEKIKTNIITHVFLLLLFYLCLWIFINSFRPITLLKHMSKAHRHYLKEVVSKSTVHVIKHVNF